MQSIYQILGGSALVSALSLYFLTQISQYFIAYLSACAGIDLGTITALTKILVSSTIQGLT